MSNYSHLTNNLWNQVAPLLDNYAKFYWDDEDMTTYHAFIINEKAGSLKFYNGPSFSNSYTKPQFESASSRFTGVTFNTQQIAFTVAVYAVTEQEYRRLVYKFHPYTIANLMFAFDPNWRYIVKLAKREDSTRYIVGYNSDNQALYYTELKLTFEVQGDAVAHSVREIDYSLDNTNKYQQTITFNKPQTDIYSHSDLETPFLLTMKVTPFAGEALIHGELVINNKEQQHTITLFDSYLVNLNSGYPCVLEYNSQTGDLCLISGDKRQILTLLSTYNSGKRIVQNLTTTKAMLPGTFDGYVWDDISLNIKSDFCDMSLNTQDGCGLNCYARTNLI